MPLAPPRRWTPSAFRVFGTIGAVVLVTAPTAISGQLVEFPVQVEEGTVFHRVVSVTAQTESPRGSGLDESNTTARIRVAEMHDDGSGTLEVVIESIRIRSESPHRGLIEWDSTTDPVVTDEADLAFSGALVGRSFSLPFLAGGVVDMAPFMEPRESEAETLELWTLVTLAGPQDRADGLPTGFPPALRMGVPHQVQTPFDSRGAGLLSYTLVEVEESGGRQVARVEMSGEGRSQEGVARYSGHILFDLDTGRMVEEVRVLERHVGESGNSGTYIMETRTRPVR